jgi:hypothetical protein
MRFAKMEVLEWFERQGRSYRLALLCTYWLRDTASYKPSASEDARGFQMNVRGKPLSFADLADMLEQHVTREALASDFLLNQLHALIRAPFEILNDYCEDYDKESPARGLLKELKVAPWYAFTRLVRNAISHSFYFDFHDSDKQRMPITWNGITLAEDMDGQRMKYELWHKPGYELFLEMLTFAKALPE